MKTYALCPCCDNKLIHHISHHRDYWFCRSCWQEMPIIDKKAFETKTFTYQQPVHKTAVINSAV